MAGLKVKSHLESLMGTDVIKLNDREYMLSLQSRLMKEYENVMDKQVSEIYLMCCCVSHNALLWDSQAYSVNDSIT